MGRYDEALADLTRAIELDPSYAGYFALRGQAYQATGNYDESLADFTRATELNPSYKPPTV
jgi:tetratricopeptide (TPR) repeat protein